MFSQLKIFIELTRLNKPIGIMLLFWPCSWGLAYAYSINNNLVQFLYYLFLFFLGSVLMRSAGCIVNDIIDKDFDKKVKRTKNRPLASNKVTINQGLVYIFALCLIAFIILIQFNHFTIILGMSSMILAFAYPFMKRITYWPQLFLGLTFNWGILMAWTASNSHLSIEILLLYLSAIFWTLGYDTIYGAQDIEDDEIIGLKSTSIKFKKKIKFFVFTSYSLSFLILINIFKNQIGINYFTLFLLFFLFTLFYQISMLNYSRKISFLKAFKLNNLAGFFLFITICSL